jgi:N-acetylneuraminic acid mutarotase/sugar lactone lactonase YvrE
MWLDHNGNFWLFGGYGTDSVGGASNELNDFWEFSPATNEWTWMGGLSTFKTPSNLLGVYGTLGIPAASNFPGARYLSSSWTDTNGNLWLFGGYGDGAALSPGGELNDFWEFSPSTLQWTWMGGSTRTNTLGVYGTMGVPSAANNPGGRHESVQWIDSNGNFWLLGGVGFDSVTPSEDGTLNDLWEFSPSTNEWTWMGGNSVDSPNAGYPGIYGSVGVPATTNIPGSRYSSVGWTDSSGNLWLFGGSGFDSTGHNGELNDLWEYTPSSNEWTWISGSVTDHSGDYNCSDNGTICGQVGIFGTLDSPAAGNTPGGITSSSGWVDSTGNFWLFGGAGFDSAGNFGDQNVLWEYLMPQAQPAATPAFSLATGTYTTAQTVTISDATPGAAIYFTTNGSTPTPASTLYSGSITLASSETLKAIATAAGYSSSPVAVASYTIVQTPAITWAAPTPISYGTPLSATQLNATSTVAGTFNYSSAAGTVLTAGQQTLTVTFTPTDTTDYATAASTVTLTVKQAAPTISWTVPAAIIYGTPLSAPQLNASSSVAGAFSYSPAAGTILTAGPQTLTATFTPTDTIDYTTVTSTVTLTVIQATPAITWTTPAAITYPTALSATQLNATSTVTGSFTYSPAAGTVLSVGQQTLTATFVPTDNVDYTTASAIVTLTVNPTPGFAPSSENFSAVNIGNASPVQTLTYTFGAAVTLGSTAVLTQGATGLDFTNAGTGNCKASTAYIAGQTCTINVTFTPKYAGTRLGAAVLYDGNGNAIATGLLQGTGVGPQVNFLPGTQTSLGSGFGDPWGMAVDGSGNVYVADFYNNAVYEMPAVNGKIPNSPTTRMLGSGFGGPRGVAVDSVGNVYVADTSNGEVKEMLAVNGSIPASPTILVIGPNFNFSTGTGFNDPIGVTVDPNGNVFVVDGNEAGSGAQPSVYEILAVNGSIPPSPTIVTLYTGVLHPNGIAVDNSGDVYFADPVNNAVYQMLAVNGRIPASPALVTLATGFNSPIGLAIDGSGNLYVGDTGNNAVKELLAVNGSIPAVPVIETLVTAFGQPYGLAVNGAGNVFVADGINSSTGVSYGVWELDYADAPSQIFATTAVGSTSSDSPHIVSVENVGNAALSFPIPSSGSNPSIAANFTLNSGGASACPLVKAGASAAGTLAAGASCILPVSFSPTVAGALSGSLVLTDNNLNAPATAYSKQSIALSGTSTIPVPSFTLAISPASLSITQGASGTSTITVSDKNGFTGKVTLAVSGLPSGVTAAFATNPTAGTSVLKFTTSSSATTGAFTVTVKGTSGALSATTTLALTVNPAPTFIMGASPASLTVAQGASGKSTITVVNQNGFTGKVTLAASGLPSGVTAAFGTNPTTGTSILTLTASSTAATGTATVTIKGTSGSLTASTTVALTISCTPTTIVPYISVNGGSSWTEESSVTVNSPSTGVDLGPQPSSGGSWSWTGPSGYKSTSRQISGIPLTVGTDSYLATYTNASGCKSTDTFTITVK